MKITADTNVLVRAIVADDPKQAKLAQTALARATLIAVTPTALCEFVWVLSCGYGIADAEISQAIRQLLASASVEANRPVIEAGLALMEDGGDFADGVIAFEGANLGADVFASFDRDAVKRLKKQGRDTLLLA